MQAAAKVCVLGSNVADQLFGEGVDPTGQQIRVRNHVFRVIGVITSKGASAGGQNQDDQVFAPYTTVHEEALRTADLNHIFVSATVGRRRAGRAGGRGDGAAVAHDIEPGEADDFTAQTLRTTGRPPDPDGRHDDDACWRVSPPCRWSSAASVS